MQTPIRWIVFAEIFNTPSLVCPVFLEVFLIAGFWKHIPDAFGPLISGYEEYWNFLKNKSSMQDSTSYGISKSKSVASSAVLCRTILLIIG